MNKSADTLNRSARGRFCQRRFKLRCRQHLDFFFQSAGEAVLFKAQIVMGLQIDP